MCASLLTPHSFFADGMLAPAMFPEARSSTYRATRHTPKYTNNSSEEAAWQTGPRLTVYDAALVSQRGTVAQCWLDGKKANRDIVKNRSCNSQALAKADIYAGDRHVALCIRPWCKRVYGPTRYWTDTYNKNAQRGNCAMKRTIDAEAYHNN